MRNYDFGLMVFSSLEPGTLGSTVEGSFSEMSLMPALCSLYTGLAAPKAPKSHLTGSSPTLLLIFYLLIDKNDVPLVIDQPEEN